MTGRNIYGQTEKKYSVMLKLLEEISYNVDNYTVIVNAKELYENIESELLYYRTGRNTHILRVMVTFNNILSANDIRSSWRYKNFYSFTDKIL